MAFVYVIIFVVVFVSIQWHSYAIPNTLLEYPDILGTAI